MIGWLDNCKNDQYNGVPIKVSDESYIYISYIIPQCALQKK